MTAVSGVPPAVAQYGVAEVAVPRSRVAASHTKTTVMEILSVDWYLMPLNMQDANTGGVFAFLSTNTGRITGDACGLNAWQADLKDPTSFAAKIDYTSQAGGVGLGNGPWHMNLTDSNGNGVLVATDRLFVVTGGISNAIAGASICKILYRLVNVSMAEFIGIVQSGQG